MREGGERPPPHGRGRLFAGASRSRSVVSRQPRGLLGVQCRVSFRLAARRESPCCAPVPRPGLLYRGARLVGYLYTPDVPCRAGPDVSLPAASDARLPRGLAVPVCCLSRVRLPSSCSSVVSCLSVRVHGYSGMRVMKARRAAWYVSTSSTSLSRAATERVPLRLPSATSSALSTTVRRDSMKARRARSVSRLSTWLPASLPGPQR